MQLDLVVRILVSAQAMLVAWFGLWMATRIGSSDWGDTIGSVVVVVVFVAYSGAVAIRPQGGLLIGHALMGAGLTAGGIWLVGDDWRGAAIAGIGFAAAVSVVAATKVASLGRPRSWTYAIGGVVLLVVAVVAAVRSTDDIVIDSSASITVDCGPALPTVFQPDQQLDRTHRVLVEAGGPRDPLCLPDARRRLATATIALSLGSVLFGRAWPRGQASQPASW